MSGPGERPASPRPSRLRRLLAALALTLLFFALIGTLVVLNSGPETDTKHPPPPVRPIDRQSLQRPAPAPAPP